MNVLVCCEFSQVVCSAFRSVGCQAFSCDILPCSGGHPEWHIMGDALALINGCCSFVTCDGESHCIECSWDLLIAHPPCTYLSKAGARWLYREAGRIDPERAEQLFRARLFFQQFLDADCERIAIENPTPLKLACLPPPTQVIQPFQFGHPYSKRTLLWLKGLPLLCPTQIITEFTPWMPSNTGGLARGKGGSRGIAHDPKTASITFSGIAAAMSEQWGFLYD